MAAVDPFAPAPLGPLTLRNRLIKAATFEGMAPKGRVSEQLVDFHRTMAAGGVGMTNLAYCAVSPEGRGAPNEIIMQADRVEGLERLTAAVHDEGAAVCCQLGHAGPVAANTGIRGLSPSRVFSPLAMKPTREATVDDLRRIIGDFASAATTAADNGFDAVELHFGHGYLVSSFLSPKLNKRTDDWGGSLENRARLAREVAGAVHAAVGGRIAVVAKLNMADGVDGGLWLDESLQAARLLQDDGTLDALVLTGGSSFENPMYLFRGEAPIAEMAEVFPQPIKTGFKLFGRKFLPSYPYEEAYFLSYARQFLDAFDLPLVLLGGINRLDTIEAALDEGFAFVQLGRALLREPDLPRRLQQHEVDEGLCVHCNKCMPTIYRGTHCVLVPPDQRPGLRVRA